MCLTCARARPARRRAPQQHAPASESAAASTGIRAVPWWRLDNETPSHMPYTKFIARARSWPTPDAAATPPPPAKAYSRFRPGWSSAVPTQTTAIAECRCHRHLLIRVMKRARPHVACFPARIPTLDTEFRDDGRSNSPDSNAAREAGRSAPSSPTTPDSVKWWPAASTRQRTSQTHQQRVRARTRHGCEQRHLGRAIKIAQLPHRTSCNVAKDTPLGRTHTSLSSKELDASQLKHLYLTEYTAHAPPPAPARHVSPPHQYKFKYAFSNAGTKYKYAFENASVQTWTQETSRQLRPARPQRPQDP